MEFKQQYAAYQQAIEEYLNGIFTADKPYGRLQEAMRYSILGGGKRIRPVLTLEFARLCGLDWAVPPRLTFCLQFGLRLCVRSVWGFWRPFSFRG